MLGVRPDDRRQRDGDAIWWSASPTTRRPAPRLPPEMLHVQQMRGAAHARRQVLHVGRQPGLRTGLAQVAEELSRGDADGAEREGWPAATEPRLNLGSNLTR